MQTPSDAWGNISSRKQKLHRFHLGVFGAGVPLQALLVEICLVHRLSTNLLYISCESFEVLFVSYHFFREIKRRLGY